MKTEVMIAAAAAMCAGGCIQLKTESEIKPIHITMDVNLKVDKDLDKAFADESSKSAKGDPRCVTDENECNACHQRKRNFEMNIGYFTFHCGSPWRKS